MAPGPSQASVEPLLDAYKPPGLIKKIYFKTLTFGDAPFTIDNVWVDKANPDEVCLEVSCSEDPSVHDDLATMGVLTETPAGVSLLAGSPNAAGYQMPCLLHLRSLCLHAAG